MKATDSASSMNTMSPEALTVDAVESREELYRRLPELKHIEDDDLREEATTAFLEHCPDYFWTVPASSSRKYHQLDSVGIHGLWLHTKRTFIAFERLARSYREQDLITAYEQDCGRAAILLHDMFKQGLPPRDEHHTTPDHDVVCAQYLQRKADLPEEVIGCIESHNGPWGEGKAPETPLEQVHHLADMAGSARNAYFAILEPCEELREVFIDEVVTDARY